MALAPRSVPRYVTLDFGTQTPDAMLSELGMTPALTTTAAASRRRRRNAAPRKHQRGGVAKTPFSPLAWRATLAGVGETLFPPPSPVVRDATTRGVVLTAALTGAGVPPPTAPAVATAIAHGTDAMRSGVVVVGSRAGLLPLDGLFAIAARVDHVLS